LSAVGALIELVDDDGGFREGAGALGSGKGAGVGFGVEGTPSRLGWKLVCTQVGVVKVGVLSVASVSSPGERGAG
jgi:hypothetical protein